MPSGVTGTRAVSVFNCYTYVGTKSCFPKRPRGWTKTRCIRKDRANPFKMSWREGIQFGSAVDLSLHFRQLSSVRVRCGAGPSS